jgi:hypothetical protein
VARRNTRDDVRRAAGFGRRILDGGRFGFVRRGFRCFVRGILFVSFVSFVGRHAFTPRYFDVSAG